ncbi:hypothetical protein [Streptomyces sp. NPDC018967]
MDAMELELSLYDWSALPCRSCKSAEHVPGELLRMARARTPEEAKPRDIEFHVLQDSWATKTAVPVARALTAFGGVRGTPPTAWVGTRGFVGGTNETSGGVEAGQRRADPRV